MRIEQLAFEANLDQLHHFINAPYGSLLSQKGPHGQQRFHCIDSRQVNQAIDRASREVLADLSSYLAEQKTRFAHSPTSHAVLTALRREYQSELGAVILDIFKHTQALAPRYDVCFHLGGTNGEEILRWGRSQEIRTQSEYLAHLMSLQAAVSPEGIYEIHLPPIPPAVVDVCLQSFTQEPFQAPTEVSILVQVIQFAGMAVMLSGQEAIIPACLRQLDKSLDASNLSSALPYVSDWDSAAGQLVVEKAAQHFRSLMQNTDSTKIPWELVARVLTSPTLQEDEATILSLCIRWTQLQSVSNHQRAYTLWHRSEPDAPRLVDSIRFEHLNLEDFMQVFRTIPCLSNEEYCQWVQWLAEERSESTIPQRASRVPFQLSYGQRGSCAYAHANLPLQINRTHPLRPLQALTRAVHFPIEHSKYTLALRYLSEGRLALTLRREPAAKHRQAHSVRWSITFPATGETFAGYTPFFSDTIVLAETASEQKWLERIPAYSRHLPCEVSIQPIFSEHPECEVP